MKQITRIFGIIVIAFLVGRTLWASPLQEKDPENVIKKKPLKAALQTVGLNMAVYFYDRYLVNEDWAQVGWGSIGHNFTQGFTWDNNTFNCNTFDHPFHGAQYFNAGRLSGLNFWESAIFPPAGSLMWEFFLETENPSINDLVMSGVGGIFLGEILYRVSRDLYLAGERGDRPYLRLLATVINPMAGVNRLVFKQGFPGYPGIQSGARDLSLSLGTTGTGDGPSEPERESQEAVLEAEIFSITPLKSGTPSPYDFYHLDVRLALDTHFHFQHEIHTEGILLGREGLNARGGYRLFGLFGYFDVMNTGSAGRQSLVGVGPGWSLSLRDYRNIRFDISTFLIAGFGGSTASHALEYGEEIYEEFGETHQFSHDEDAYYMGPGAGVRLYGDLLIDEHYLVYTRAFEYVTGSFHAHHAHEWLGIIRSGFSVFISRHLGLGFEYTFYNRHSYYRVFPSLQRENHQLSFKLTYLFG